MASTRGGKVEVKAEGDQSLNDVPVDAFRIEYLGRATKGGGGNGAGTNPEQFFASCHAVCFIGTPKVQSPSKSLSLGALAPSELTRLFSHSGER